MRWPATLTLSVLLSLGCERKAPGPEECRRFALNVSGVAQTDLLEIPSVRERVDDLTRQCLTTPFDRELLTCVEATGRVRSCTVSFERRRQRKPAVTPREQWFVR